MLECDDNIYLHVRITDFVLKMSFKIDPVLVLLTGTISCSTSSFSLFILRKSRVVYIYLQNKKFPRYLIINSVFFY